MKTLAFIDASNLFYGGEKSLGWKIDYRKLLAYLKQKYAVRAAYYFGGVEAHGFRFDFLNCDTVPLDALEVYLKRLIKDTGSEKAGPHLQRVKFYRKLEKFGYTLVLKPVKSYRQDDGTIRRKANCDVDMAFYLMKEMVNFNRALILSGDGDFLPVLKYLRKRGKEVLVLARGPRTAREVKMFAGGNFRDFEYLKYLIKM